MKFPAQEHIKKRALIASTISACFVGFVYVAAILGGDAATKILLVLTLPPFNFMSALLPDDLRAVPAGFELVLLSAWLQIAVLLTLLFLAAQTLARRAAR